MEHEVFMELDKDQIKKLEAGEKVKCLVYATPVGLAVGMEVDRAVQEWVDKMAKKQNKAYLPSVAMVPKDKYQTHIKEAEKLGCSEAAIIVNGRKIQVVSYLGDSIVIA
jgi:hypothetical protein